MERSVFPETLFWYILKPQDIFYMMLPTKYLITLLLLSIFNSINAGELIPFKSDGCSSFPDGTLEQQNLWLKCCVEHDKAYWKGGTYQERKNADRALRICVAKVGKPTIALLMLIGVRIGGTPYLPTTFRWGYGWQYLRGYKTLTTQERTEVEALTR
jgi:hypothetical protein